MAIRYVEADKKILFVYRSEFPVLSDQQRMDVEKLWAEIVQQEPTEFRGRIYCCNGIVEDGPDQVTLGINGSDYGTYSWARQNKLPIPGAYCAGDATLIYNPDHDTFVFALRSDRVWVDRGKFSATSGGVLSRPETDVSESEFLNYVNEHAQQETQEELETTDLTPPVFLGAYVDDERMKLEFLFMATATGYQLKGDENIHLLEVKKGDLPIFFAQNEGNLETSLRNHLGYWVEKLTP